MKNYQFLALTACVFFSNAIPWEAGLITGLGFGIAAICFAAFVKE